MMVLHDVYGRDARHEAVFTERAWATRRGCGAHVRGDHNLSHAAGRALEDAQLLLGCPLPEPELNAAQFSAAVQCAASSAPSVYDPLKNKMRPWIDVGAMARFARPSGTAECAVM